MSAYRGPDPSVAIETVVSALTAMLEVDGVQVGLYHCEGDEFRMCRTRHSPELITTRAAVVNALSRLVEARLLERQEKP